MWNYTEIMHVNVASLLVSQVLGYRVNGGLDTLFLYFSIELDELTTEAPNCTFLYSIDKLGRVTIFALVDKLFFNLFQQFIGRCTLKWNYRVIQLFFLLFC